MFCIILQVWPSQDLKQINKQTKNLMLTYLTFEKKKEKEKLQFFKKRSQEQEVNIIKIPYSHARKSQKIN